MGSDQVRSITSWPQLQKKLNELLTLAAYAQPQTGFGFPADPPDGAIFILQPTQAWYQFQSGVWVLIP